MTLPQRGSFVFVLVFSAATIGCASSDEDKTFDVKADSDGTITVSEHEKNKGVNDDAKHALMFQEERNLDRYRIHGQLGAKGDLDFFFVDAFETPIAVEYSGFFEGPDDVELDIYIASRSDDSWHAGPYQGTVSKIDGKRWFLLGTDRNFLIVARPEGCQAQEDGSYTCAEDASLPGPEDYTIRLFPYEEAAANALTVSTHNEVVIREPWPKDSVVYGHSWLEPEVPAARVEIRGGESNRLLGVAKSVGRTIPFRIESDQPSIEFTVFGAGAQPPYELTWGAVPRGDGYELPPTGLRDL